jgi:hypothetical protein
MSRSTVCKVLCVERRCVPLRADLPSGSPDAQLAVPKHTAFLAPSLQAGGHVYVTPSLVVGGEPLQLVGTTVGARGEQGPPVTAAQ